jgi:hypothetical protein
MGVSVIDVSSPLTPTLIGWFNTLGYAYEVAATTGRVFGDSFNGLLILEPQAGKALMQFGKASMVGSRPAVDAPSWQAQLPRQVDSTPGAQPQEPADAEPADLSAGHLAQQAVSDDDVEEPGTNSSGYATIWIEACVAGPAETPPMESVLQRPLVARVC